MSKTDRSKWSGAGLQTRSCAVSPAAAAAHSTNVSELRCEIITPFGLPVDPDVYRMYARSDSIARSSASGSAVSAATAVHGMMAAPGAGAAAAAPASRPAGKGRHHRAQPGDAAGQGGGLGRPRLVGHDHAGAAVPDHVAEPLGRRFRVERHVAGPGLQRPVYARLPRRPTSGRGTRPGRRGPRPDAPAPGPPCCSAGPAPGS